MTKRLKIVGERGSYTHEYREPTAKNPQAGESIQAHSIFVRDAALGILRERFDEGFRIDKQSGLSFLRFKRGITAVDFVRTLCQSYLSIGFDKATVAEKVTTQAFGKGRGEASAAFTNYVLDGNERAAESLASKFPEVVKLGGFGLLSETTKMGCYSFNMAPGPVSQHGTCPASAPGFMFLPEDARQKWQKTLVGRPTIDVPEYICNGCYALKGSYGNPSMIFVLLGHKLFAEHASKEGTFADYMVEAIERGQVKSRRKIQKKPSLAWATPNPDFFRIHDAGDMFDDRYAAAWFEVCRRLPNVAFWAPTRVWVMPKRLARLSIPENLALRPSALHFGDPPPMIDGYSAGSGSGSVANKGVWFCPATESGEVGGGRRTIKTDKGEEKTVYTCSLAHGPDSPLHGGRDRSQLPSPEGDGCRACWLHQDEPIYYHEH